MFYYEKYIKYKLKYLELKKNIVQQAGVKKKRKIKEKIKKKLNKKRINCIKKNNSINILMKELNLVKVKDLDSGLNGDTFMVKNHKDEFLILKLERIDATPSNSKDIPDYESEYYRQIDFDNLVAKHHPDKFMVLENHGIIKDCIFTHSKTEDAMTKVDEKRKARFIRKNNQPHCYYLLYKPVLDGTFRIVREEIRNDKELLLDFMIQIISSINIYRKLGFIHSDVGVDNIMFKKIDSKYQWYWIDYGNITNNKYPDSYLDIERNGIPFYKTNTMADLRNLINNFCITGNIRNTNPKADEKIKFIENIFENKKDIYDEIFGYFPKIDDPNLSKFLERSLFDLVYKILYPKEYSEYYKFEEYDNKEQVLKDVLLLCIKHSNDETYDNLLTSLKQYLL